MVMLVPTFTETTVPELPRYTTKTGSPDKYGCVPGYKWCEAKKKCIQPWLERCEMGLTFAEIVALIAIVRGIVFLAVIEKKPDKKKPGKKKPGKKKPDKKKPDKKKPGVADLFSLERKW